jgi:hypothetical protein
MNLPSKLKTFDFQHTGNETGKEYAGKFTVIASLNIGQKVALESEKSRIIGMHQNPTPDLIGLAIILANLRVRIVSDDAPEWYKQSRGGELIDDEDAAVALYNKIQDMEKLWIADLKKKTQVIPDSPQSPQ